MKKILLCSLLIVLTAGNILISWFAPFYLLWSILFTVSSGLVLAFNLFTYITNHKWNKLAIFLFISNLVIIVAFLALYYTGLLEHFSSVETARAWFEGFGVLAWLIFFLIQISQVVLIPIPAQITIIAGVIIFGAFITFVISSVAVVIGSIICFAIGRSMGVPIAYKISSKERVDKYRNLLNKRGKILLPIMFLFPVFPDDLLCFIAGTTAMTWRYFITITVITRIIGIAFICWFGSGDLIPFTGWGIPVWIVIGILMAIVVFLLFKYQDIIEKKIIQIFAKNVEPEKNDAETVEEKTDDYINFGDYSIKEPEPVNEIAGSQKKVILSKNKKIKDKK